MKQFTKTDVNDFSICVFEAVNGTLAQSIRNGEVDELGAAMFLSDFQDNLITLLQGKSMGISEGSKNAGQELTFDSLREPGRKCLETIMEEAYNG